MKVLFDHNVPRKTRQSLPNHTVRTTDEMGWSLLENGELLRIAEATRFDVMVTCDKNLPYQQNMSRRQLALVVLTTNDWNVVKNKTEPVVAAVNVARPGSFQLVSLD